jgi:HEAT repeat protein
MVRPVLPLLLAVLVVGTALAQATTAQADEVDALLRRLAAPHPAQRIEAAERLAEIGTPERWPRIGPPLRDRLAADPSADVRQAAAAALGALADPGAVPTLVRSLATERDERVLAAVVLALGETGSETQVPTLAVLARSHPTPSVRGAALSALGALGGEAARLHVLGCLEAPGLPDPDWGVRAAAVLALVRCGHADDLGRVLTAYREGGGEQHWFARASLARLVAARDRDPLPLLRRMVLDPDPRVAVTAAVGIARTGHLQEMLLLLRHLSPAVRAAAASAVARVRVEGAYGRLRSLARLDRSPRVRWAAALALFRLEEPAADDYVLTGLLSREPAVWAEAIAALSRRTGEQHGRDVTAWRGALRRWRHAR